jgi:tRNA(Leu) C34 or U34 (ribose-2'-O)-methylase TrmL
MTPTKDYRLPREERMKGYKEVTLTQFDYPFDMFEKAIPIAIEVRENSENLLDFEHPYNAVYVFGPEDGGIERVHMQHCHRIVTIPTKHCTNLAAAVYLTLYDRYAKRVRAGKDQIFNIGKNEQRGYEEGAEFG